MDVMAASFWASASLPSNGCISSAGGPPDTTAPALLQRLPATRHCDFHNCCKAFPKYCSILSFVQFKINKKCLYCFSVVFLIVFGKGLRLRDWRWGIEYWALGIGAWGVGVGHWAPGIGSWEFQACPWPTPSEGE